MKAKFTVLIFFLVVTVASGQQKARTEVKEVVDAFIEALNQQDIKTLKNLLDRNVGFMTVFYDGSKSILAAESLEIFLKNIEEAPKNSYFEELINYRINSSDILATVWSEYNFYLNDELKHCGENAFQLYNSPKGWKIIQITDTRYNKTKCHTKDPTTKYERKASLIKFIDGWHESASESNFDRYFNAIARDGIYIGTDPDEYWTKEAFKQWAKSYFKNKQAWHFETIKRNIFFAEDEDLAWFHEKLNTSMGICQATGVAEFTRMGWKIRYYQLSVTVPNELLEDFIELKKRKE